jgi:hypothetical protein
LVGKLTFFSTHVFITQGELLEYCCLFKTENIFKKHKVKKVKQKKIKNDRKVKKMGAKKSLLLFSCKSPNQKA